MGLFENFPYTNFQDLNIDSLLKTMKIVLERLKETETTVDNFTEEYSQKIDELETYIENLDNGIFSQEMLNSLFKWLNKNVPQILQESVKNIWFSLDSRGRLVANVPDSWKNISFKTTGYDIVIGNMLLYPYGHLVILDGRI